MCRTAASTFVFSSLILTLTPGFHFSLLRQDAQECFSCTPWPCCRIYGLDTPPSSDTFVRACAAEPRLASARPGESPLPLILSGEWFYVWFYIIQFGLFYHSCLVNTHLYHMQLAKMVLTEYGLHTPVWFIFTFMSGKCTFVPHAACKDEFRRNPRDLAAIV